MSIQFRSRSNTLRWEENRLLGGRDERKFNAELEKQKKSELFHASLILNSDENILVNFCEKNLQNQKKNQKFENLMQVLQKSDGN